MYIYCTEQPVPEFINVGIFFIFSTKEIQIVVWKISYFNIYKNVQKVTIYAVYIYNYSPDGRRHLHIYAFFYIYSTKANADLPSTLLMVYYIHI